MASVASAPLGASRSRAPRRPLGGGDDALEAGVATARPAVLVLAVGVAVLAGAAGDAGGRALVVVAVVHATAALLARQATPAVRRACAVPAALADLVVTAGLVAATGGGASVLAALGPLQGLGVGLRFRPGVAVPLGVAVSAAVAAAVEVATPPLVAGWTAATGLAVAAGLALARGWARERRRLRAAGRRAQRATSEQEDLVRRLCHELRTPIASLSALSRAVSGSTPMPDEERRRALDLVERHADHLAGVLDEVRSFTEAARTRQPADQRCDVWLPDLVDAAAAAAGVAADRLDVAVDPAAALVRVDRVKVRQVLTNLLENAVRHGADDHPVVVRATAAPDGLRLDVANAGRGPRTPRSPGTAGSGLGLGIVGVLVEAMGGRLTSAPWRGGLRVAVELPVPSGRRARGRPAGDSAWPVRPSEPPAG